MSSGSTAARGDAASWSTEGRRGVGAGAGPVQAIARRQHRPEQQRLGEVGAGAHVRRHTGRIGQGEGEDVVRVDRRRRRGDARARRSGVRLGTRTRPGVDDPAGLQFEQREVRPLQGELSDDAEAGQVRMHRAVVQPEIGSEDRPQVPGQVGDVEAVSGRADDRVDAFASVPSVEGHLDLRAPSRSPAGTGSFRPAPARGSPGTANGRRARKSALGSGAPKSAGFPATRSTRSRRRAP